MGLREILDDLLPADTPDEVTKKMLAYAKKHPDKSEAEVVAEFKGSMSRAKRKKKEKDLKGHMATAAAKRKITKAEGKTKMAYGGMSGGKKHNYAAGGVVKDNPGLKALKAASPEAYNKITGR